MNSLLSTGTASPAKEAIRTVEEAGEAGEAGKYMPRARASESRGFQGVHLDFKLILYHERVDIYPLIAEFMLLENQAGRHADFHGGVQCICDPSTCRHTADADDLFRVLEEICTELISRNNEDKAWRAIRVFERMPPCYKHIAKERHRRVRRMYIDRWGNPFDGSDGSEDESEDESEGKSKDESEDESEDDADL
ncbi:hypothetical protein ACLOAV_003767 [Pseudogymnoascus australis]